ncbi:MAG: hypothetical protein OIF35_07490 [Cellvibrionaceae bacterium]|nr:hypothetical protein [Cellvibrionaceae bacterium]MCV6627006.1 hypothetical protein [Cellvibrionaceae bacterium]
MTMPTNSSRESHQHASFYRRLGTTLHRHYSVSARLVFKQFRLGVALFFVGLVGVYANYQLLMPSVGQELFLLCCLIIVGMGFVIAMLAQIRMLFGRLLQFIEN